MRYLLSIALLLAGWPVQAQMLQSITNATTTSAPAGYVGALDAVPGASHCYSMQACSAAIAAAGTQKLFQIERTDTHKCNVLVASSGGPVATVSTCDIGAEDGQTITTWCTATTCNYSGWYDQVGSEDYVEGTFANQPLMNLTGGPSSSVAALVCSGAQDLGNGVLTIAQPFTIAAVSNRTGGTTSQTSIIFQNSGSFMQFSYATAANNVFVYAGSGPTNVSASDNAWHSLIGVFNGASSSVKVDSAAPTTVSAGAASFAPATWMCGFASSQALTGRISEIVIYSSALSSGDQATLEANQHTRMGF